MGGGWEKKGAAKKGEKKDDLHSHFLEKVFGEFFVSLLIFCFVFCFRFFFLHFKKLKQKNRKKRRQKNRKKKSGIIILANSFYL